MPPESFICDLENTFDKETENLFENPPSAQLTGYQIQRNFIKNTVQPLDLLQMPRPKMKFKLEQSP